MKRKTTEDFIKEAIIVHGDRYDYSKSEYINTNTNVIIICKEHGEFNQTPKNHIKGQNCPKCRKGRKYTTNIFLEKAIKIHGDTYDYSQTIYENNKTKVKIICKKHGPFDVLPSAHLKGNKCIKCAGVCLFTTKEFIEKAIEKHGDKYDYSNVDYINAKTKVEIICKIHGKFLQNPDSHLRGQNCPKCSKRSYAYTRQEWIDIASEKHGDKYDYSKVDYVNSDTKVNIICKIHGEFMQKPANHSQGQNCPKCFGNSPYSTDDWIEKAIEKHGDKYDYSKVEYINYKTKITIICKEHGEFMQNPYLHINSGCGCPKHGDKYDYSCSIYVNSKTKIVIICKSHGEFMQNPSNHLYGSGCLKCYSCPSCFLWMTFGKLCQYCKPKNQNKLYHKTKEMDVVNFLKANLPDNEFIHNKSVGSQCTDGHLFPDVKFDCLYFHLIVEIDEFRHRGASYSCDEKRMYDLVAKLGQICVFIRYNPDNKKSDKNELLQKIKYYLDMAEIDEDDDIVKKLGVDKITGFKAEYMFY